MAGNDQSEYATIESMRHLTIYRYLH